MKPKEGIDLTNKTVVLAEGSFFQCLSGFGCNPSALGRAIFGYEINDKNRTTRKIDRQMVKGIAEEQFDSDVPILVSKDEAQYMLAENYYKRAGVRDVIKMIMDYKYSRMSLEELEGFLKDTFDFEITIKEEEIPELGGS